MNPIETDRVALTPDEARKIDAYWRAANYLSAGMIYLRANPLLREPLNVDHIKRRLLGHWGTDPGQSFIWVHLNRVIKKFDLNVMYIAGPGHGAPATLANSYLEGYYSEVYPECAANEAGMLQLFRRFSFPGGIGSHCTPETPGSIHEGGELGHSLSHGYGAAFDNPDLIVVVVVGDGEAETGPLATSWHSNKFLNPARDGAVLPVLHLNGYKIDNPTILARIPKEELEHLFLGYGYQPFFVEGDKPEEMHCEMADVMERCINLIRSIQQRARLEGNADRPIWPVIILRSPKGWTGPKQVDGHAVEGDWRAHQIPIADPLENEADLRILENWLRSYRPEELFDDGGTLIEELRAIAPVGPRRISANPHANGGKLLEPLDLPELTRHAVPVSRPGMAYISPTATLGTFLRDVMRKNMSRFRVFGPDENSSNKLMAIYEASNKTWNAEFLPSDAEGGHLARDGRVMEMLSEHTLEGWFEGYVLTGRHGLLSSYEAFIHVIDSMFNQHAKWLEHSKRDIAWRAPIASINLLITSLVWRQDHNGFTHQDPGFLDVVGNKSPEVVRVYLPPDANCLLSIARHCLLSENYVNVIVADKQPHLTLLDMEAAVLHCTKGIGVWDWASTESTGEPDVVLVCAGDVPTMEALAAAEILREKFPELKVRFVNIVDLYRLVPPSSHPHGLTDEDFDAIFTHDKPVIFNFHSYPALVHKLIYKRRGHANFHVHGYREKGSISTPLELAILNHIDRFSLCIDVIDQVPQLGGAASHVREWLNEQIIEHVEYAHREGIDQDQIRNWSWSGDLAPKVQKRELRDQPYSLSASCSTLHL